MPVRGAVFVNDQEKVVHAIAGDGSVDKPVSTTRFVNTLAIAAFEIEFSREAILCTTQVETTLKSDRLLFDKT